MKDRDLLTPPVRDIPSRMPAEPPPKVSPDGHQRRTGPVGPTLTPEIYGVSRDELSNTLLDERYRLDQPLGRGGMGVVYRAFDTKLKRVVAVKLLSEPGAAHRERFEREVHALSRLAHPNLVQLLDAELGSRSYLVMELVEGTTLAAQLANGPLSPEQTAELGAGTACALAYVHTQGIVHRDVKPANVLVDGQGKPYLADFGIARLLGTARMTATGLALGTPAYLAPEQLLGNEIGPETDVYALGLVLIECLSGRPAFDGTEAEVLAARLHRDPMVPAGVGRKLARPPGIHDCRHPIRPGHCRLCGRCVVPRRVRGGSSNSVDIWQNNRCSGARPLSAG